MIDSSYVPVFAARESDQCGFLVKKTVREFAGIHKRFQDTWKTSVIFRYDKNKLLGSHNTILVWLKRIATGFIHICRDEIDRQFGQRKNMSRHSFFYQLLLIICGQFKRITMWAIRTGYDGNHDGLN